MSPIRDNELKNREPGLTTAALAGVDEPTPAGNGTDRAVADEQQIRLPASTTKMANSKGDVAGNSESDYQATPLFSPNEATDFRARWDAVQVGFVDEPRHAVEEADGLVANAMKRLAEIFADERAKLDGQWDRGDSVSTEDLRLALRRYRSFFGRLLSI